MAKSDSITPEMLRELLEYNPATGELYWKMRPIESFESERIGKGWNTKYAGKEALWSVSKHGYRHGYVMSLPVKTHRVAWAIYHGEWPASSIDHINCDKTDNRITNLRLATDPQNGWNVGLNSKNTSGYKGVTFYSLTGKWRSRITVSGQVKYLGYYDTPEEAHAAYCEAAKKYHGEFARTE